MSLQIVQNQQLKPIGDQVPIDTQLSTTSENAISNKAVTNAITQNIHEVGQPDVYGLFSLDAMNGTVDFTFQVSGSTGVANGAIIDTLPITFRPTSEKRIEVFGKQPSGIALVILLIAPTGVIKFDAVSYNENILSAYVSGKYFIN